MNIIKTIMVVDDNSDILKQLISFLEKDKFDIISVKNRREALERIESDKMIDLVLINTEISSINKTALFSMKPNTKPNIEDNDNFLTKPFTKTQLKDFINKKI